MKFEVCMYWPNWVSACGVNFSANQVINYTVKKLQNETILPFVFSCLVISKHGYFTKHFTKHAHWVENFLPYKEKWKQSSAKEEDKALIQPMFSFITVIM